MVDIPKELDEAEKGMAIDHSQTVMPLSITVRSVALTIAQKHCGDTVVSEGNLYQQLKLDGKLGGPLTVEHVLRVALMFERYLWGEWSKEIAGKAMADTMAEVDEALREHQGKHGIDDPIEGETAI